MQRIFTTICAAAIVAFTAGLSGAEEVPANTDRRELERIVITATTTEKEIESAPGAIEVITAREIRETGAQNIAEALEGATGVLVESNTGRMKSPIIRGTGNRHTLVLLDGRRISLGYKGFIDIEQIPVDIVDHIEILRGPASSLYGSDAIGGVLNIITKKIPSKTVAGITTQGGINNASEGGETSIHGYAGDSRGQTGFLFAGSFRRKSGWDKDGVVPDDGDDETLKATSAWIISGSVISPRVRRRVTRFSAFTSPGWCTTG